MRNYFESGLRRPWALACAFLLFCYAMAPINYDGELDFHALAGFADYVALIISFPLGLLAAATLDRLDFGLVYRSQLWAICLVFGYVQWFHVVPFLRLHRRRAPPLVLNLRDDERVAPAPATLPAGATPARLAAAHAQLMPHFNEHGRTPLERVFDN
ncbi:MAG TPA: hypothetical protein VN228_07760 [Pyrinomonadaceae bacterium]|nr:hypothetical protein [Pyrinomonadaceae bacterium]